MKVITGNILNQSYGIIGHQVNCQLVMGAGIAKQLKAKWPRVYTEYKELMGRVSLNRRLGKCQIVQVSKNLYVANLFAQYNFLPRKVRHTDYIAMAIALRQLNKWRNVTKGKEFPIFLPYGIGCGLAGGSWERMNAIVMDVIPDTVIVKLPTQMAK